MNAQDKPPERPPRTIPPITEMREYSGDPGSWSRSSRVWLWGRRILFMAILVAAGVVLLILL